MKCDQICKWNSNVGCVKPYGVPCILENVSPTDKKATNADRIRAMSDEELAECLEQLPICKEKAQECIKAEYRCGECLLEWLKQPAEGE